MSDSDHTTLSVIPGSTIEPHVQVSNVSLTADTGDKWMTVNFFPQPHHKGHSHVKKSNVEGSTIVSVIHKKQQQQKKDLVIQHYFKVLEGFVMNVLK